MTINVLHLLWIVPATAAFTWMLRGFIESGKRDDEILRQIQIRDICDSDNWRGGWGA